MRADRMFFKPKSTNFLMLIFICALGASCKKEIYNIDGCEFTQNGVNQYSFSCIQKIDATATFSDDDIKSIAITKVEKSGAQLAVQKNQTWFFTRKISAKLNPNSKYPDNIINIKGKILIGDIKLSQKFRDAKNVQAILNNSK